MADREIVSAQDMRATGIPPGVDASQIGTDEPTATPQDEQQLEQAVTKMRRMVHGRSSRNQVIDQLNDKDVPVPQAVGRTAAGIVGTIEQQAKASGIALDNSVLVELGMHTVQELLEVGIAGGFYKGLKEGTPQYEEVAKLAMLEGAKSHGEKILAGPGAQKASEQAQDYWAQQIAQEVDNGTADPRYLAAARSGPGQPNAAQSGRDLIPTGAEEEPVDG